ncbi:uncharacterized protein LOC62_01G000655 [Vanrija pseudolonga]|uniref:Uncharacterized protein n=1 Tax=Vanrija pseudolonga TaxID=143232 RepID=A0AAF0Y3R4_9TREE|nr:hypothetical protein LOC62_01G000655 [Vanrija pseudolonga]
MSKAPPPSYHDAVSKGGPPPPAHASSSSASATPFRRRKVGSLTLRRSDRIMALGFPSDVYQLLGKLIPSEWSKGIQKVEELGNGGVEYKLKGNPWTVKGKNDSIPACRLVMRILSAMLAEGWGLAANTGTAHSANNTDTLYFRDEGQRVERTFFVVSFWSSDRIRIIDAPEAVTAQFVRLFSNWPAGVQKSEAIAPRVHEFKLKGYPFTPGRKDEIPIRLALHELLETFDGLGYEVFGSIGMDQGTGGGENSDVTSVDTWFLTGREDVRTYSQTMGIFSNKASSNNITPGGGGGGGAAQPPPYYGNDPVHRLGGQGGGHDVVDRSGGSWKPDVKAPLPPPPAADIKAPLPPPPAAASAPPPPPAAGPSASPPAFAAMLLSSTDKIRLLNFPEHMSTVLSEIVTRAWPQGIQQQYFLDGHGGNTRAFEIKCRGNPWYGQGKEAIPSRRFMIHLLFGMSSNGWHLDSTADMSKKQWDKDTLIFRSGPPVQRSIFSITFNEYDKVRIIDPPNEAIKAAFVQVVHNSWPYGIQETREKERGATQVKLKGNPWITSQGQQVSAARILALNLISTMDAYGYELRTIDMSATMNDDIGDMDTWLLMSKLP